MVSEKNLTSPHLRHLHKHLHLKRLVSNVLRDTTFSKADPHRQTLNKLHAALTTLSSSSPAAKKNYQKASQTVFKVHPAIKKMSKNKKKYGPSIRKDLEIVASKAISIYSPTE